MIIYKCEKILSDGSRVYNLTVTGQYGSVEIECNSAKDADDLQFKLAVLLAKHTTEQAVIR